MLDLSDYSELYGFIRFFEEISAIPHGSGNTDKIADYLEAFATERGLKKYRDSSNNVIIYKDATVGYGNRPTVILQGHTDMVAEKLTDCQKDMSVSGPDIYRDGDFLRARGTTLGGDDGVMVAYALSLLNSDSIPHPALECIFTSDEEIGLIGATELDTSHVKGKLMINIDSDEEGVLTVGCAGGVRADISLPITREDSKKEGYTLTVDGLTGGHSGIEIDKGRENAIKLISVVLSEIGDLRLISILGGNADNAIPRDARAEFTTKVPQADLEAICAAVEARYSAVEKDVRIRVERGESGVPMDEESTRRVLTLINEEPSGVIRMDENLPTLVETSLNMGICKSSDGIFELSFSIRSSINERKAELLKRVTDIAVGYGATVDTHGSYPGWKYKEDSHLRDVMCRVYESMYGRSPKVVTIHAGLECGIFSDKIENLDCVSIGPDNFGLHSPDEHMSIPSVARVWEYLKAVLAAI